MHLIEGSIQRSPDSPGGSGGPIGDGSKIEPEILEPDNTPVPKVPIDQPRADAIRKHAEAAKDTPLRSQYWLMCHRCNATDLGTLEKFLEVGLQICANPKKVGGARKQLLGDVDQSKHAANPYLKQLVEYALDPLNAVKAVSAATAAKNLNLKDPALFLGTRALGVMVSAEHKRNVKRDKAHYLELVKVFEHFNDLPSAVRAINYAEALDPKDDQVLKLVKDLTSKEFIQRTELEKTTEAEGGFVKIVKDREGQLELHDQQRSKVSDEAYSEQIVKAREAYQENPADEALIKKLVDLLRRSKVPEDQREAIEVLEEAGRSKNNPTFLFQADDVRIAIKQRAVKELEGELQTYPEHEDIQEDHANALKELLQLKIRSYQNRIQQYPQQAEPRVKLAELYLHHSKKSDEAIKILQPVANDNTHGGEISFLLGSFFNRKGFYDEAIIVLETALEKAMEDDKVRHGSLPVRLNFALAEGYFKKAGSTNDRACAESARAAIAQVIATDLEFRGAGELRKSIHALIESFSTSKNPP